MLDKIDESKESGYQSDESYRGRLDDGEFKDARIGIDEYTQGTVLGQVPWDCPNGLAGTWKCKIHNPETGWGTWYIEEQEFNTFALEKPRKKGQRNRRRR